METPPDLPPQIPPPIEPPPPITAPDQWEVAPPPVPEPKRPSRGIRLSRDLVLFVVGIVGILHETFISHAERPSLLLLFAALCGLPLYLRRNGL